MKRKLSAFLAIAVVTILGLSNMALQSPTALRLAQIPPTNTLAPVDTNTPAPPSTSTPAPPSTSTPAPPSTSTSIPPSTPVVNTPPPGSTSTPIVATKTPKPGGGGGGGAPAGPSAPPNVNSCVRAVGKNGVGLSTAPGFYQPFIQDISRNEILWVVDGPQRVDAIWWWKLRSAQGVEGWGNQDDITPDPGPCALVAPIGIATLPAAVTPSNQLPQTGGGNAGWFFAGVLLVVVIVSGILRRRFQTETHSGSQLPD